MCDAVFISQSYPIARKPRECPICGWNIVVGERYVRRVQKNDGELDSMSMHVACEGAGAAWCKLTRQDCYDPLYLIEDEVWLGFHPATGEWLALDEHLTERYDEERDEYLDVPVYRSGVPG